jgi:hypothetical protein
VSACVAVDNQGNCTLTATNMPSDGDDVLFGDLGNDWSVGGTGKDTLWAGWGNDLSNADDVLTTNNGLNDLPDGPNSSFEDRVFGGAGLDILIGNTGGDRLIDWVGEFNSYLVPFAPFGIATVSRQVPPQLPEFLYALSRSQGVDMTRATDVGSDPVRNGEPFGELGLITQHDHGQWQTQTGGPTDPQAGNIPGGRRDILRSADFNDGSAQSFAPDSGSWTVQGGKLQVTAASLGQDAVAVWNADAYLPIYYEITAAISMQKPTAGWKANSYVVFDYWGPNDFKFAGIDVSINKMVIGHRNASGWWYDAQGPVTGSLTAEKYYNLLVAVNGTFVTVSLGKQAFSFTFAPRILRDGDQVALNKGLLGFGSNSSRGLFDNISLGVLAPQTTLDVTETFDDGTADNFPATAESSTGLWDISSGRYVGTATAGAVALSAASFGASGIDTLSFVEVEAAFTANGVSGLVFDYYASNDYKFVVLDVPGQRVLIGHVSPRSGWVVDQTITRTLTAGMVATLNLLLKATVATVTLNGQVLASRAFNSAVVDGRTGVLGIGAVASFDRFRFRTDDDQFVSASASVQSQPTGTTSAVGSRLAAPDEATASPDAVALSTTTETYAAEQATASTTESSAPTTSTTAPTATTTSAALVKAAPLTINHLADGGVSFTVTGANNRDFYSVRIVGDNGYSTVLTVVIGPDGTGTTAVIHPPPGSYTVTLEIPKQINRPRVLYTDSFTVP